jgi:hypothetical protein
LVHVREQQVELGDPHAVERLLGELCHPRPPVERSQRNVREFVPETLARALVPFGFEETLRLNYCEVDPDTTLIPVLLAQQVSDCLQFALERFRRQLRH